MRKPIIGVAVAATLALGGTALAASGGPGEIFGDEPERDFAEDLAAELGGDVSTGEVQAALEAVAEDRMAEHQRQMAEGLAEHLDGVTVDEIEAALTVAHERMREGFEEGQPPEPGLFTEVLAEELGIGEGEVEAAIEAAREEAFSEHREQFEKRFGDIEERVGPALHERFEGGLPAGPPDVAFAIPVPED